MHRAGRRCVRQLLDGIGDPAPGRGTVAIAFGFEVAGARGAFLGGVVPEALEHQERCPPDVDFRDHRTKTVSARSGRDYPMPATRGRGCLAWNAADPDRRDVVNRLHRRRRSMTGRRRFEEDADGA